jgi:large subunit ribosomal protein L15
MHLGEIKRPPGSRRNAKRLGQGPGSGTGKTAGRGHKGQRARSGSKRGNRIGFEGGQMATYRHMPKIGFSNQGFRTLYQIVNVGDLEASGAEGSIGPQEMARLGLIRKAGLAVKVLGGGELTRGLKVRAHVFSRSAAAKLDAAGGTAEVI